MIFSSQHTQAFNTRNGVHARKAFTLPEVLISVLVLVLVIFASTSLLVGVMRSNNENIRTLQAYGLAQEALEGARNIRDSNWLLGGRYDGTLGSLSNPVLLWNAAFPDASDADDAGVGFYTIDLWILERSSGFASTADLLRGNTPWVLTALEPQEVQGLTDVTRLQIFTNEQTKEVRYGHEAPFSSGYSEGEPSLFHRFLVVENVSQNPARPSKYRVSSVVRWQEGAREKEVRLDTVLTNWNQGQL